MAYDSAIASFTVKTDKVDLVQAAHINAVQSELVTIETILGTGVKGTSANLKTRLNNALDGDGSILSGTAYPSPGIISQLFYRTDIGALYVYDGDWTIVGETLSNVIFQWHGALVMSNADNYGLIHSDDLTPGIQTPTFYNHFFGVEGTTYRTILTSRWTKISGVNTVTIHANLWGDNADADKEAILGVTIGTATIQIAKSVTSRTPTWYEGSTPIDVSGLTNGTTYDITIQLKSEVATINGAYCGGVVLISS
jgi:hypothetical protein